jgi:transposase
MLADAVDVVIGVDTHRDRHAFALVAAPSGALLGEAELEANAAGYAQVLALVRAAAPSERAWAVEGTGSYGAGLTAFLTARGERVLEVERPRRPAGRRGKSDKLDALAAARALLGAERPPARPRAGGKRAALAALLRTRESALQARRGALCQLRALLLVLPDGRRQRLRGLTRARLLHACARLRAEGELGGLLRSLRSLARRIQALDREARLLERELEALVEQLAPGLLAEPGVGPISAAQLLASWSHKGRLRSEAAFARLAGAPPVPASSGETIRHRLDHGGDRQLNRALHTIVVSRRKHHADTITYIDRRRREGKSTRDAIRCLKRYLARQLFRFLEAMPQQA